MSKKDLRKYLKDLKKKQLEEQVLDLYDRFKDVKEYYTFIFNPNELKILEESKFKISKEYFPLNGRKPKARRSIAQKMIRKYQTLQVDPQVISEIMIYNIEITQTYNDKKSINQEAFYKSVLNSFREAIDFIQAHHLLFDFKDRIERIVEKAVKQDWFNHIAFENKWSETRKD